MKVYQFSVGLLILGFILSCKKEVEPMGKGISGTWLLFQNQFWDGRTTVTQNIVPFPARTITLTSSGELSTTAIEDSSLNQYNYFQTSYSDLIGPILNVSKTKNKESTPLKYLVDKDTLQVSPIGLATFGYKFRRLK